VPEREARERWVEIFSALASEQRLHIVEILTSGEVQCQEILRQLNLSQPAVSYHLAKLERAGVLTKERIGTRRCYKLNEELKPILGPLMKEDG
jgi:ArsR family transcriptional regulator